MMEIFRVLDTYLGEGAPVKWSKKMAAADIKRWLSAVDLESEVLPEKNTYMLCRLIASLKGEELSKEEEAIIFEVAGKAEVKKLKSAKK